MSDGTTMTKLSTWHPGETAIQQQVGVAERMEDVGRRVVRDFMPDQHRAFYEQIPFIVAGTVDPQGDAWATLIAGAPGFIGSPSPTALEIAARPDPSDPASAGLRDGDALGLLGIELHTRRRNRVNGLIRAAADGILHVAVDQSFGNCPQYIRTREAFYFEEGAPGAPQPLAALDDAARALIASADTLFIASAHADGVDVSHRGGEPGFVSVDRSDVLTLPDYAGNFFFNTLGNLLLDPRAGLLFIDFDSGDLLHVSARAEIVWDGDEVAAHPGAQRLLRLTVTGALRVPGGLPLEWSASAD